MCDKSKQKYSEIKKLAIMLIEADITFDFKPFEDGYQIIIYQNDDYAGDVSQWKYSYGGEIDQLEIFGCLVTPEEKKKDTVLGYLDAETVYERILEYYGVSDNG